jgi:hypothetical protein
MTVTILQDLTYCNTTYAPGDRVEMEPEDAEPLEAAGIVERYRPPSVFKKMLGAAPENKMSDPPANKKRK